MECKLCKNNGPLRDSHVIPAFAVRWIKSTAATPFIRGAESPNLRKQDIGTTKLLCQACETRFSQDEGIFAEKVFKRYVSEELDEKGRRTGRIPTFDYESWLLRFVISMQWRVLATRPNRVADEKVLGEIEWTWRQFLLGERGDTGVWENYMIFMSSFGGVDIPAGLRLGKRVNMYIVHSVDATTVSSESGRHLGIYSKLGPIALYTPVKPRELKGNADARVHRNGSIKSAPNLGNGWLNQFMFITRPNEAHREISDRQLGKMTREVLSNPIRAGNSMSFHLLEVDFELEKNWGT